MIEGGDYLHLRRAVYRNVSRWDQSMSAQSIVHYVHFVLNISSYDDEEARQKFSILNGPYGRVYWEMLKVKRQQNEYE